MTLEALQTPGPARSAALIAATASLRMNVGLCPDRGRAAAAAALDSALAAALKTQEPRP